ncbi:hypothetical protein THAR02_10056 [Trichoderma harzianum]|uniref:Glycine-rich cell wall structural protein 1 n=1 Tax=Trichoderma harzianum TaxID=5544 RepID=A0A0F9WZH5_TRIHA|nr:hypothetical protein THAR02_10056 [Trichoderma harzianum]
MSSAIETINQLATSAAKAVWGDSSTDETHKEPISGATGDVSKGEPYDAGNLDPKDQNKIESSLKGQEDEPSDLAENEYYALSSSAKDKPLPESPRTQEPMGSALQDRTKSNLKDTTNADDDVNPEEGKPLDKLTGAGPRPVEELAKENGGNAAAASSNDAVQEDSNKPKEQKLPEDNSQQRGGDQKWEATEDDYVKTTGLAADGGNFDAAKPGAGVEADRLMEQKGMKTDDDDNNNHKAGSSGRKSSDSGRHHKDKPSLGERIKNKLHRH